MSSSSFVVDVVVVELEQSVRQSPSGSATPHRQPTVLPTDEVVLSSLRPVSDSGVGVNGKETTGLKRARLMVNPSNGGEHEEDGIEEDAEGKTGDKLLVV